MRLAIVAASSYEENGQVAPIPNAELDVELFGGRLADADAGFFVHAFPAQRGLAEGIDELLARLGERPKELILYFWGYALNSEERGPTLLLDGPKLSPFTLARLRRQLSDAADVSLVVLDATLAEGSSGAPLDVVRTMGSALSGGDSSVSSLIAVRLPTARAPEGPPPFTGLVQMILDAHTGSAHALTPDALFRAMQAEEVMFADIPAAGCFLGSRAFVLVPGAKPLTLPPRAPAIYQEETDEVTAPRFAVPESQKPPARGKGSYRPPPPPRPFCGSPRVRSCRARQSFWPTPSLRRARPPTAVACFGTSSARAIAMARIARRCAWRRWAKRTSTNRCSPRCIARSACRACATRCPTPTGTSGCARASTSAAQPRSCARSDPRSRASAFSTRGACVATSSSRRTLARTPRRTRHVGQNAVLDVPLAQRERERSVRVARGPRRSFADAGPGTAARDLRTRAGQRLQHPENWFACGS